jgi:hypothetical protein
VPAELRHERSGLRVIIGGGPAEWRAEEEAEEGAEEKLDERVEAGALTPAELRVE